MVSAVINPNNGTIFFSSLAFILENGVLSLLLLFSVCIARRAAGPGDVARFMGTHARTLSACSAVRAYIRTARFKGKEVEMMALER